VVSADGSPGEAEVVRIGPFIAMSEGRYVAYKPDVKALTVLARQPSSELTELAEGVAEARSGYVRAAVDPSRGVLLDLYVQRPNVIERIEKGELVGYVIITVGVVGAVLALYQFIYLLRVRFAVRRQLANLDEPRPDNPLGRVLATFKGDPNRIEEDAEVVELRISEAVLREVPTLERFQAFLRLAVAAGPLLGLVGTVVGMIITFQSITESGSSDPRLMANGISQAMIATVLGLGIAIPLLFVNAGLASMSRGVVQILDEQSTGMLAESLERLRERDAGGLRAAPRAPGDGPRA
jgi:biopolymer transport protein ExbB